MCPAPLSFCFLLVLREFRLKKEKLVKPGDVVDDVGLQQQVSTRQQVFCDEVLVGPHSYTVTHTQGAQHVQNLRVG